jgi:hypothetical protein
MFIANQNVAAPVDAAVYVVEPSYFLIGYVTDTPEVLTANLNKIIDSGYGYYTDGDVVAGVRILGKFSKL